MELIIQIVIGLVAAFAIYNLIHYLFVTRPSRKRTALAQRVCNEAVKTAVHELMKYGDLEPFDDSDLRSEQIAEIWGRGVMAFEYHLPISKMKGTIPEFKKLLATALVDYGNNHHMHVHFENVDQPVFMVTDMWQLDDRLHFDVAYLVNLTTVEYVDDLKRL